MPMSPPESTPHFSRLLKLFEIPPGLWGIGQAVYEAGDQSLGTCVTIGSFNLTDRGFTPNVVDSHIGFDFNLFADLMLLAVAVGLVTVLPCVLLHLLHLAVRRKTDKLAVHEKLFAVLWGIVAAASSSAISDIIQQNSSGLAC